MKFKRLKLLILILLAVTFGITDAAALDRATMQSQVTNGSSVLVCSYGNKTGKNEGAEIYYNFEKVNSPHLNRWQIYYRENNKWRDHAAGNFQVVFSQNSSIHRENDNERFSDSFEANFYCPKNNFMDFDWFNELCFGDSNTCGKEFEGGPYGHTNDGTTIFEVINKYAEEDVYDYLDLSQLQTYGDTLAFIKNKTRAYIVGKYGFVVTYKMPEFIDNYLKNLENYIDLDNNSKYQEARTKISNEIEEKVASGEMTEEEAASIKESLSESLYETMGVTAPVKGVNTTDDTECEGLLGPQMTEVVNNIFSFIQYLAPLLIAVLSIVDFIKVSLSGDDGDMKKASQKLIKRIICGILLFFIPIICKTLFGIAGITVPEYCIGK